MKMFVRNRRNRCGSTAVEFAMVSLFLAPMIVGTLSIGGRMMRSIQAVQIARDAGHMYARGIDFSLPGNKALIARLGEDIGMTATGNTGNGLVILSTIMYVGRYQCKAIGYADSSTPPNPDSRCKNYGHFVFTHRVVLGNANLPGSHYGDPLAALLTSSGYIKDADYVGNEGARADQFILLPKPQEDGNDGFQAGHFAYLSEAFFRFNDLASFGTGNETYSYALF